VLLGIVLIVLGMSTIILIPLVVVGFAVLLAAPVMAWIRKDEQGEGSPGADPTGIPTTREASYDPVQEP
jgi:hypothetical protein